MSDWARDVLLALRALARSPSLVAVVALTIGLGVGANAMVYTWLDQLVLDPFPAVPEAGKLVVISPVGADGAAQGMPPVSYPAFREWRERTGSLAAGAAAHALARFNVRRPGESAGAPAWGELVSGNFFEAVGVEPFLGRSLARDDEETRAAVAVVSERYWRRELGADPQVVGRQLLLNGVDLTVVGVAPPGFGGIIVGVGLDVWVPVTLQPQLLPGTDRLSARGARWLQVFGRLGPGVTLESARSELDAMARRVSAEAGESPVSGASLRLIRETQLGSLVSPLVSVLLVVTGLVLLAACSNVANLLLARGMAQHKETGIRFALGASRFRVASLSLVQSGALALLGGLMGLFLARWAGDVFQLFIPAVPLPVSVDLGLNLRVVAAAFLVTLFAALAVGVVPAVRGSRFELVPVLKEEGPGFSGTRSRLRSGLVVAQVTFAMIALVLGGVFLRSLSRARAIDVGYEDPGRLLLVGTDLDIAGIETSDRWSMVTRLLERSRALPGVASAAFSTMVPLGFGGHVMAPTRVEGYTPGPEESVECERAAVSDGYFLTMGIPILRGRAIDSSDRSESLRVAVVNETFASRYWPGLDPIGRRLAQGEGWSTVVGVARDSTYRDLGETPYPVVWSSLEQSPAASVTLHVRVEGSPHALVEPLRGAFASVHADLPLFEPRTLSEHMAAASFVHFVGASMLGAFGTLSLVLAAVGIFGVMSYTVSLYRRDIAIAIALGASSRRVVSDVLAQGLRLVAIGITAGGATSFFLGRLASSRLPIVEGASPGIYALTATLITLVAVTACLAPAVRAARTSPSTLLR